MRGELWCGQAQNGVNLDFQVKFDLEDQGWSFHNTIRTLTKVFCIFGPNLVILAWTGLELSRGQASDWHTDRQTDTHKDACNDNTRSPKLASGKKLCNIRGDNYIQQARLPPNNAGRPMRQFKCPLAWLKWRTGSPLVRYCFIVRGYASS